ncbi:MAG TPA: histidine kinase [Spirillospora sp.]
MNDLRRASETWRRLPVMARDLPFPLVLFTLSLLPAFRGNGTQIGDLTPRPYDGLAYVAIALQSFPLIVRRRLPAVCVVIVAIGLSIDQLRAYHTFAGPALPIALISCGAHLERFRRTMMVVLTAGYVALAIALGHLGTDGVEVYVVFYLTLAAAWCIGSWLRSTRAAEAERRRRIAEATRTAERTRIARELHDVVTHHVTAMVVQAEAARYLTATPARLDETLSAVTDTGRRAIADLRHLLDLLNPDADVDAPTRSVGELQTLVEQTRRAGQPVEFTEEGSPGSSTGAAGSVAYRVVQEALTNALKYAHGSNTVVVVRYGEKEITVEVTNDGTGSADASPGGSGRGLAGLRERVEDLGGELHAGPAGDGGFRVRARIPVEAGS